MHLVHWDQLPSWSWDRDAAVFPVIRPACCCSGTCISSFGTPFHQFWGVAINCCVCGFLRLAGDVMMLMVFISPNFLVGIAASRWDGLEVPFSLSFVPSLLRDGRSVGPFMLMPELVELLLAPLRWQTSYCNVDSFLSFVSLVTRISKTGGGAFAKNQRLLFVSGSCFCSSEIIVIGFSFDLINPQNRFGGNTALLLVAENTIFPKCSSSNWASFVVKCNHPTIKFCLSNSWCCQFAPVRLDVAMSVVQFAKSQRILCTESLGWNNVRKISGAATLIVVLAAVGMVFFWKEVAGRRHGILFSSPK